MSKTQDSQVVSRAEWHGGAQELAGVDGGKSSRTTHNGTKGCGVTPDLIFMPGESYAQSRWPQVPPRPQHVRTLALHAFDGLYAI
eukprot:scaffold166420_cov23-Prasinocladus_malaysianus.AAC.1